MLQKGVRGQPAFLLHTNGCWGSTTVSMNSGNQTGTSVGAFNTYLRTETCTPDVQQTHTDPTLTAKQLKACRCNHTGHCQGRSPSLDAALPRCPPG